ncbi:aspartyl/asparaginyl beta-hydroxylase domain-containing protein [Trinickia sp. LjRoot230]|uniref:aspartyl/asparaginyl beta-hydroxylase domain-containing protein n=1 Tax=Trinickia sp. LjRoot230 TaxID=3342288 RepID=UPI003ED04870
MFHDPQAFEFIGAFEAQWEAIRAEVDALDAPVLDLHRNGTHEEYLEVLQFNNGWMPSWQVGSDQPNGDWLTYGLSCQGLFSSDAGFKYPTLYRLLSRMAGYKVCALSQMKPRSVIAPHAHAELGGDLLTFHLGIDVPDKHCYLNVEGEFRAERNRQSIVFDGSREHFAINLSEHPRTILYMEFSRSQAALRR